MSVGTVGPWRPTRHADGNNRQQQRGRIGQHVRGLGIQRHRIGPQAAAGFDQREREQQPESQPQSLLTGLVGAMNMTMTMIVRVPMLVPMGVPVIVGMPLHMRLSYRK